MKPVPVEYRAACERAGKVEKLDYGEKFLLLYTPIRPARRILYLIHGGGGDQYAFFCPEDIAFPNLDPQMKAMAARPDVFGGKIRYDVMEGGVHDYETIFRYLYNALPENRGEGGRRNGAPTI